MVSTKEVHRILFVYTKNMMVAEHSAQPNNTIPISRARKEANALP